MNSETWVEAPPMQESVQEMAAVAGMTDVCTFWAAAISANRQPNGSCVETRSVETYAPEMWVSAESGLPGATVDVRVSGFAPNSTVDVYWGSWYAGSVGTDAYGIVEDGGFYFVPPDNASPGTQQVQVADETDSYWVNAPFTLLPSGTDPNARYSALVIMPPTLAPRWMPVFVAGAIQGYGSHLSVSLLDENSAEQMDVHGQLTSWWLGRFGMVWFISEEGDAYYSAPQWLNQDILSYASSPGAAQCLLQLLRLRLRWRGQPGESSSLGSPTNMTILQLSRSPARTPR